MVTSFEQSVGSSSIDSQPVDSPLVDSPPVDPLPEDSPIDPTASKVALCELGTPDFAGCFGNFQKEIKRNGQIIWSSSGPIKAANFGELVASLDCLGWLSRLVVSVDSLTGGD